VLLASAAAAALAASRYRGVAAADPAPPIEAGLAALKDQYNAKVGFYGLNLSSNRILGYRENDIFATCSAFKAYVAAQILQKDQRAELRLTDELYIDPARFVPVASPITEPNIGGWMTLSDLCAAAVRQSDNTATNLCLTNRIALNSRSGCAPASPATHGSGRACPRAGVSPTRPAPVITPAPTTSGWHSGPTGSACCSRS
jgi:beta-lactamase class A